MFLEIEVREVIELTEASARKILDLKKEENQPSDVYLRIRVKIGGCSGFSYKMEFSKDRLETDKVFASQGVSIVVDPQSYLYIMGLRLEYEGGLNGKGFSFSNPNAAKTCGCGTSFAV